MPEISFTEVTAGTAAAEVTANLNRLWRLSSQGDCANLPRNLSRRKIVVDAQNCGVDLFMVISPTSDDPSSSQVNIYINAGTIMSLDCPGDVHHGAISIGVVSNTSGEAAIVTEYSY